MLKYKAGYIVEIDTYENDGDNSKTEYFDGLTKEQAIFVTKFADYFSENHWKYNKNSGNQRNFGNTDVGPEEYELISKELSDEYKLAYGEELTPDNASDMAGNYIGGTDYDLIREVDGIKVYYIPDEFNPEVVTELN
jgi:hypothetical protein